MFTNNAKLSHAEVERAVRDYLARGGVIRRVEPTLEHINSLHDEPLEEDAGYLDTGLSLRQWMVAAEWW